MIPRIEDYALLSSGRTAALIAQGSVDWLCLPRFDSASVFTRLLGDPDESHWLVAPRDGTTTGRAYREGSFVLDATWSTPTGAALSTDLMPTSADDDRVDLVRRITCTSGRIEVDSELVVRFDYGRVCPWVRRTTDAAGADVLHAIAGPDSLTLHGPTLLPEDHRHRGHFELAAGESLTWVLTWRPSHLPVPSTIDVDAALGADLADWRAWHAELEASGPHAEAITRSLAVLRALTHRGTGGIVAAPTTSLPEDLGGVRNWDYRYCWLRDSALTISVLVQHGQQQLAHGWRDWLLRAIAGDPDDLQVVYGLAGERELPEQELQHLRGYGESRPVRIGNGAVRQYQADVVGAVMLALRRLRDAGCPTDDFAWALQTHLLEFLTRRIEQPDCGLWEARHAPRFYTHSRVLMWAGFDAGVRAVSEHGLDGPVDAWRAHRDRLRDEVERDGVRGGAFVQHAGTDAVDAALLQLPHTGFVAPNDPRMLATVARIEAELLDERGFVHRYRTDDAAVADGVAGGEGSFLLCTFWLVEQYARSGRAADARALMDRTLAVANDVGLLAEEYDAPRGRLAGNFPQAFSHLALVRAADALYEVSSSASASRDASRSAKRSTARHVTSTPSA